MLFAAVIIERPLGSMARTTWPSGAHRFRRLTTFVRFQSHCWAKSEIVVSTRLREQPRQGLFIAERSFAIVHILDLAGAHISNGTSIVTTTALQREQA